VSNKSCVYLFTSVIALVHSVDMCNLHSSPLPLKKSVYKIAVTKLAGWPVHSARLYNHPVFVPIWTYSF